MIQKSKYDGHVIKLIESGNLEIDCENGVVRGSKIDMFGKRNVIGFSADGKFHITFLLNGKTVIYPLCRAIYLAKHKIIKDRYKVYHIDGDVSNNRIENLSLAFSSRAFSPLQWSKEEEDKLISLYQTNSYEKLSEMFGRSIKSIRHKIKNLSLSKKDKRRKWTNTDDKLLETMYENRNVSINDIAIALGRSEDSVRLRANRICSKYRSDKHLRENFNEENFYLSIKRAKARGSAGLKCCLCDYDLFVELHHIDGNRKNNHISNISTLCPTHHVEVANNMHRDKKLYSIWWRIYSDGKRSEVKNNLV